MIGGTANGTLLRSIVDSSNCNNNNNIYLDYSRLQTEIGVKFDFGGNERIRHCLKLSRRLPVVNSLSSIS